MRMYPQLREATLKSIKLRFLGTIQIPVTFDRENKTGSDPAREL